MFLLYFAFEECAKKSVFGRPREFSGEYVWFSLEETNESEVQCRGHDDEKAV